MFLSFLKKSGIFFKTTAYTSLFFSNSSLSKNSCGKPLETPIFRYFLSTYHVWVFYTFSQWVRGEGLVSQIFHVNSTKTVKLRLGINVGGNFLYRLSKGGVNAHLLLYLVQAIEDSSMIAAAEELTDIA